MLCVKNLLIVDQHRIRWEEEIYVERKPSKIVLNLHHRKYTITPSQSKTFPYYVRTVLHKTSLGATYGKIAPSFTAKNCNHFKVSWGFKSPAGRTVSRSQCHPLPNVGVDTVTHRQVTNSTLSWWKILETLQVRNH